MAEETPKDPGAEATGMTTPAQARSETIARSLMGDGFVNQFGDVIGVRKPAWTDRVRDAAIGFSEGIGGLESLRSRVRKEYNDRHFRQQQAAVQQEVANRQKAQTIATVMQKAMELPPKARKAYLKEAYGQMGIEPSQTMLSMVDDMDFISSLNIPQIQQRIAEGTGPSAEELEAAVADPNAMANLYGVMKQRAGAEKELNSNIIAEAKDKRDAAESAARIAESQARTDKILAGEEEDDADGDAAYKKFRLKYVSDRLTKPQKDKFGRPLPTKTMDELNAEARAIFYGATPPPVPSPSPTPKPAPEAKPAAGITQAAPPMTTTTPSVSTPTTAPASTGAGTNPAASGVTVERLK